jgi:peptide deformylase
LPCHNPHPQPRSASGSAPQQTQCQIPNRCGTAAGTIVTGIAIATIAATGAVAAAGSGTETLTRLASPGAGRLRLLPRLTRWRSPRKSPRMALREIIIIPDKRLRQVSEPVKAVDAELRALIDDMFETMYEAPGVGLAAIQVAVPKRVITIDTAKKEEPKNPQVFINPEILWSSDEKGTYEEGCLSIPEYYEEVERPTQVKVRYMDLDGKTHEIEANGFLATVLQHEIDHINGILFIDHISKLKRDRVIKKYTKAAKRTDA